MLGGSRPLQLSYAAAHWQATPCAHGRRGNTDHSISRRNDRCEQHCVGFGHDGSYRQFWAIVAKEACTTRVVRHREHADTVWACLREGLQRRKWGAINLPCESIRSADIGMRQVHTFPTIVGCCRGVFSRRHGGHSLLFRQGDPRE